MTRKKNYFGHLLAAHPLRPHQEFRYGVLLVVEHQAQGALGFQLNKSYTSDITLESIMLNMGIIDHSNMNPQHLNSTVYAGGGEGITRVSVLHSLDWSSVGTVAIADDVGLTQDLSIIAALAQGHAPRQFRILAGHAHWPPGYIEGEVAAIPPWNTATSWTVLPATNDLVFDYTGAAQWQAVIDRAVSRTVDQWFG
jgi:putative transcriptional regulator